ncbi:hypothetical protein GCM10009839_68160 [Catenulispora yoronensis]|uniref:Uncharacterized protein n=2 Tax=Catenulispora yoronensis TaxID=450799 RepID=A0ABP5GTA0_9ACTN
MSRSARRSATKRSERRALAEAHRHLDDVEIWFVRRGLPHFIENYRATEDVFKRALPLFVVLVLFQMGLELTSSSPTWADRGIGAAIGFGTVLVVFLAANLARQPHAWYRLPRVIGAPEIAVLVVLGPAVGKISHASWKAVLIDAVANVLVLGLAYAVVSYAMLPVVLWALRHSVRELGNLVNLASKALPMLALFGTFLFLNVDMWHISSSFEKRSQLWWTTLFFALIIFGFLMVRLPGEVKLLSGEYTRDAVMAAAADTPLARHLEELDEELPQLLTNRRQRINMLFVLAFTQIIQILLLAVVVFLYFVSLGKLAVNNGQVADWLRTPECKLAEGVPSPAHNVDAIMQACGFTDKEQAESWLKIIEPGKLFGFAARIPLGGEHELVFSEPLLRTAILLTTFSAFFFAVSAVTDEAYRKDFFESITGKLTKCLTIRCGYVHLYEKATSMALADHGLIGDPRAVYEDHRRTVQVPVLLIEAGKLPGEGAGTDTVPLNVFTADGSMPTQPVPVPALTDPVAPAQPSKHDALPPMPAQPGSHDAASDDPFTRWPQQGS